MDGSTRREIEAPTVPGRISATFSRFSESENAGALIMLAATVLALILANAGLAVTLEHLWHTELGVSLGEFTFAQSLKHWIDDALMAIFFFVVGLEIKREVLVGELSSLREAALPVLAALGGMLVPAVVYAAFNASGPGSAGWGIPMATDIAFAIAVVTLLGSRVPTSLKVFLTALAIADDIGAIFVIAAFYSGGVSLVWLAAALAPAVAMWVLGRLKVDALLPYAILAALLWFALLNSGVHATIAGVIAALLIPTRARVEPLVFARFARVKVHQIEATDQPGTHVLADDEQQRLAFELSEAATRTASPLQRAEHALLPLVNFVVLPLFALANAAVVVVGGGLTFGSVGLGVFLGLVVGKPLGVIVATWLGVRLGGLSLPGTMRWHDVVGAGVLAGIGFTMSIFVANLAFGDSALAPTLAEAKLAILAASVVAGTAGYLYLRRYSTVR